MNDEKRRNAAAARRECSGRTTFYRNAIHRADEVSDRNRIRRGNEAQHRAQIDDPALSLTPHYRQHFVRDADNTEDVDVKQGLSLGNRRFFRASEQSNARIVDK